MARKSKKSKRPPPSAARRALRRIGRWTLRVGIFGFAFCIFWVLAFRIFNPPTTFYMASEARRLGGVERQWVSMDNIAPDMARSAVAAEDANFCLHWGFDVTAIRQAIEDGGTRGASTISQQVVKNVYLWHGRSWVRKALETGLTLLVETAWSKKRILEVYLNVAEFDEGIFGVEAAAQAAFGVAAADLSPVQAARLAAVLPNPKERSAREPTARLRKRAAAIADGAATIRKDARGACFES